MSVRLSASISAAPIGRIYVKFETLARITVKSQIWLK